MISLLFLTVVAIQLFGKPSVDVQAQKNITNILTVTIIIDLIIAIMLILG